MASQFDDMHDNEAIGVTLSDQSIYAPSPGNEQKGFRRAELQFKYDENRIYPPYSIGKTTFHWSIRKDQARPLNLSHEYQLVFLEDSSYSTNQVVLKTGNIYPATGLKPDSLVLLGNVNSKPVPQLFNTSFTADVWHNFAVTMDFDKKYAALLTQ